MKNWQARHGDVLLTKIGVLPITGQNKASGPQPRIVLAYGEQSGHAHVVTPATPDTKIEEWVSGDKRYVMVEGGIAVLDHEEHGKIELEPGTYEVKRQREFDEVQGFRQVMD